MSIFNNINVFITITGSIPLLMES